MLTWAMVYVSKTFQEFPPLLFFVAMACDVGAVYYIANGICGGCIK